MKEIDILAIAPATLEDQAGNEWAYHGNYEFLPHYVAPRALKDIRRIAELEMILERLGYCIKCDSIPKHSLTEPTSSCRCGTGEDYTTRPLQKLQLLEKRQCLEKERK